MVAPTAGEVVVIPFPFSDLTQSKVRPALCLAVVGRGDYVLCQITSQPYGDPLALKIDDQDFASGGLHVESFVRPGKLFTADANLIVSTEGKLSPPAYQRVLNTVVNLLRVGHA
ncbi:MAG: type II toxin-antitoxin system PemK/MazF family toxin [Planctomycetaceae bacterium]